MGNSSSSVKNGHRIPDRLKAWDMLTFEKQFNLNIAELEFLYGRYGDLRNAVYGLTAGPKTSAEATGESRRALASSLENLTQDWLARQVYKAMFPQHETKGEFPTFEAFLKEITRWRDEPVQRKLEFVFDVLNINKDKKLSILDFSYILHAVSSRTIQKDDVVRIRGDNRLGLVKYIGPMSGRKGIWVGLEMRPEYGKNDGSIGKDRYFTCDPRRGLFVPLDKVDVDQIYQTAERLVARLDRKGKGYLTQKDFVQGLISEEWVEEKLCFRLFPDELRSAGTA